MQDTAASTEGARTTPPGIWTARAFLVAWSAGVLLVLASLMTGHWVPLPTPNSTSPELSSALSAFDAASTESASTESDWSIYHVLYADCRCSRSVFDYIASRPAADSAREIVLLVGDHDTEFATACAERGIGYRRLTQDALKEQLGIEAAPLFLVRDPQGSVRYLGGYTDRKQALDYSDTHILAKLQAGEPVKPLPVFGCGVSSSLQAALDPFGIKY